MTKKLWQNQASKLKCNNVEEEEEEEEELCLKRRILGLVGTSKLPKTVNEQLFLKFQQHHINSHKSPFQDL